MSPSHLVRLLVLLPLAIPLSARGEKPFRYPEGKHGKGELKYVGVLPVLTVAGTPEEIGIQIGILAVKPLKPRADALKKECMKALRLEAVWTLIVRSCEVLLKRFPEDYRTELEAMARSSGVDRELLVVANTLQDVKKLAGCSTLVVEPSRSAPGRLLFGRNWDFPPIADLPDIGLVIVYRPKGKKAFVSVGFPGVLAPASAMNESGLAIAANEITATADGSPRFDPSGVPMTVILRRLIEECASVGDADKLLRSVKRTTMVSLTVCDRKEGAVFEVTPKTVLARRADRGLCYCTNHFVGKGLATPMRCWRYEILEKTQKLDKLSVKEVAKQLHAVNQREWTQHSMVFEPAALKLHLSIGRGPASARPLTLLDLTPYFKKDR
jgi:isopenicillin-N N-acyltransferase like protein